MWRAPQLKDLALTLAGAEPVLTDKKVADHSLFFPIVGKRRL